MITREGPGLGAGPLFRPSILHILQWSPRLEGQSQQGVAEGAGGEGQEEQGTHGLLLRKDLGGRGGAEAGGGGGEEEQHPRESGGADAVGLPPIKWKELLTPGGTTTLANGVPKSASNPILSSRLGNSGHSGNSGNSGNMDLSPGQSGSPALCQEAGITAEIGFAQLPPHNVSECTGTPDEARCQCVKSLKLSLKLAL